MSRDPVVVALDIGTTKICTLLAEIGPDREISIVGVGVVPSRGMKKGMVVNIDEAAHAIRQSVERCERISGYQIESAYVGVTGSHISGMNRRGVIAVSNSSAEIGDHDVERAREAARVQALVNDREILHVLPRVYTLDGQEGIRDPVGMVGRRLEAEMHIVTAGTTAVHNLVRCVDRAGLHIDDMILQPLASAEAVLTASEKESGVAVADIGGGTTDIAVFSDGAIYHTGALGIAGNHITKDIALGLRCSVAVAEAVKKERGNALASAVDPDDVIEIQTYQEEEGELISTHLVAEIIESRAAEILSLIGDDIRRAGMTSRLPAGLVLVGGSAELRNLRTLGREILGMPVRIGTPTASGLTDTIMRPAFATSIGLLEWAAYHTEDVVPATPFPQWKGVGRLKGWFREFLA